MDWKKPEIVWPLSLAAGFAGTWAGLATRVPGVACLAAALLIAPIYGPMLTRGKRTLALFALLGWSLGVLLAIVAVTGEHGTQAAVPFLPLGATTRQAWTDPGALDALRDLVMALIIVVSFRPALGLLGLLCLSLGLGALGGAAASAGAGALAAGWDPLAAVAFSVPPHGWALLVGTILLGTLQAESSAFSTPVSGPEAPPRALLYVGAGLMALGALLEVLLGGIWTNWLQGVG